MLVTDSWNDLSADSHDLPYWQAGEAKKRGQRDGLGRERVGSDKSPARA